MCAVLYTTAAERPGNCKHKSRAQLHALHKEAIIIDVACLPHYIYSPCIREIIRLWLGFFIFYFLEGGKSIKCALSDGNRRS